MAPAICRATDLEPHAGRTAARAVDFKPAGDGGRPVHESGKSATFVDPDEIDRVFATWQDSFAV